MFIQYDVVTTRDGELLLVAYDEQYSGDSDYHQTQKTAIYVNESNGCLVSTTLLRPNECRVRCYEVLHISILEADGVDITRISLNQTGGLHSLTTLYVGGGRMRQQLSS